MIDEKILTELLVKRRKSKETKQQIDFMLWELSDVIVSDFETTNPYLESWHATLSHDDLRTSVWLRLKEASKNFNPHAGTSFSYFYRCGIREIRHLIKRECWLADKTEDYPSGQRINPAAAGRIQSRNPVVIVDTILERTRNQIAALDSDSEAFKAGSIGIAFLEQFKRILQNNRAKTPGPI